MEDSEIMERYWQRSESALDATGEKYGPYLRKIAHNILGSYEDAEECENEVYLAAWNTIPPERPADLKFFLGRIARNIALDRHDYNTARRRNPAFCTVLSELEELLPAPGSAEEACEAGELVRTISAFLRTVRREDRIIFVRRYWHADTIAEIAKQMNTGEGRVKSSLFRTRNKLRHHLQKEGFQL